MSNRNTISRDRTLKTDLGELKEVKVERATVWVRKAAMLDGTEYVFQRRRRLRSFEKTYIVFRMEKSFLQVKHSPLKCRDILE